MGCEERVRERTARGAERSQLRHIRKSHSSPLRDSSGKGHLGAGIPTSDAHGWMHWMAPFVELGFALPKIRKPIAVGNRWSARFQCARSVLDDLVAHQILAAG